MQARKVSLALVGASALYMVYKWLTADEKIMESKHVSRNRLKNKHELSVHVAQNMYLDDCRSDLVQEIDCNIQRLVEGKLKNKNRFHRLILGRKAVGKSTLLTCVANAVRDLYPEAVVCLIDPTTTGRRQDGKRGRRLYEEILRNLNPTPEAKALDKVDRTDSFFEYIQASGKKVGSSHRRVGVRVRRRI